MSTIMDTSCLYSTVKNVSGSSKIFGFLPPHGRTLANNEEFTVFGDIRQNLGGNQGAERSVQRRANAAFEAAVEAGDLEILHTASPIYQDNVTNLPKMIVVGNAAIAVVDPCWQSSVSGT